MDSEVDVAAEPDLVAHHIRQVVAQFLAEHAEPGDRVLLAVSGGADSIALAAAAAAVAPDLGISLHAVSVDHQLQPGSAAVATTAVETCKKLGIPGEVVRVVVPVGEGLEAAARAARYAALQQAAVGSVGILLAHTLDDQAETVLLRLTRGSGNRSLAGMREVSPQAEGVPLWRPLLRSRRAELVASLDSYGLAAHVDPHNSDPRFLRVRVRQELLPVLRDVLGPGVEPALARSADLAREDADALDGLAAGIFTAWGEPAELEVAGLAPEPLALQTRLVRLWLLRVGVPGSDLGYQHIRTVHRLATDPRMQGPVRLPAGVEIGRESGRLRALPR